MRRIAHTTKLLKRDHGFIEDFIVLDENLLVLSFSNHNTRIPPTKVIHAPERVYREEEAVDRVPMNGGISDLGR